MVLLTPTITFNDIIRTFGDAPFRIRASSNSTGSITYDLSNNNGVVTISDNNLVTILSSGTVNIIATQAETQTYLSGTKTITLTVDKKEPTITNFSDITKIYLIDNPNLTLNNPISDSDGSFNFTVPNDNTVATVNGNQVTIIGAGSVNITATQSETSNYNSMSKNAQLIVQKKYPEIIFNNKRIHQVNTNWSLTLNNPISNSDGSFNYTSSNTNAVTISTVVINDITYYKLTAEGLGTSIIEIIQNGTNSYYSKTIRMLINVK